MLFNADALWCHACVDFEPSAVAADYTTRMRAFLDEEILPAEAAYDAVKPILQKKSPQLVTELDAKFAAVYAALQPYKTGTTYVAYTDLTKDDTKALSQVIDSLAEPLSKVSKQVVGS